MSPTPTDNSASAPKGVGHLSKKPLFIAAVLFLVVFIVVEWKAQEREAALHNVHLAADVMKPTVKQSGGEGSADEPTPPDEAAQNEQPTSALPPQVLKIMAANGASSAEPHRHIQCYGLSTDCGESSSTRIPVTASAGETSARALACPHGLPPLASGLCQDGSPPRPPASLSAPGRTVVTPAQIRRQRFMQLRMRQMEDALKAPISVPLQGGGAGTPGAGSTASILPASIVKPALARPVRPVRTIARAQRAVVPASLQGWYGGDQGDQVVSLNNGGFNPRYLHTAVYWQGSGGGQTMPVSDPSQYQFPSSIKKAEAEAAALTPPGLSGLSPAAITQAVGKAMPHGSKGSAPTAEHLAGALKKQHPWALGHTIENPTSLYELRAGAYIPATLITGVNSQLPGEVEAQVSENVYDTATGRFLLIPQGAKLIGQYVSDVAYGSNRIFVAWQRVTFPDGRVLDLGSMPGADQAGYSGFSDKVNNHYLKIFGSALALSAITGGIAYSTDKNSSQSSTAYGSPVTLQGELTASTGNELGQVTSGMIQKEINIAPTITIRPGYNFVVEVTKDITFPKPYRNYDY